MAAVEKNSSVPLARPTDYAYTYCVYTGAGEYPMNITLSADEKLIAKAREYAKDQGTTLNQLLRDYMARVTGEMSPQEAGAEFERLARSHCGRSPEGWKFDREEIHERGHRP